jgi:predicted glycoside hydrolase/deacetylase ChbG (UPF0249 family)
LRRLIINADDFGLTAGVSRAIARGHHEGIITSTTLMANGAAFAEAAELARTAPELSVGCHVGLLDGRALAGQPNTLSENGRDLRPSLLRFAAAVKAGRVSRADMRHEAALQICRLQEAGITPTHVDTHKHAHMLPEVAQAVMAAALECDVPAVRNPFEPLRAVPWGLLARRPGKWLRLARVVRMSSFAARFRRLAAAAGLNTPDGTLGIVLTGALDLAALRAIARAMPEGTWELVCHPGYHDPDLDAAGTWLRASRARELETLTAPAAADVLREEGVKLISYRDLV